ncbi:hypothetical protein ACFXG6_11185 [Streptomyces roseus]|uniref:hypothetical protein n=1 Tax=Streptomyces roseus TaxID=66430 RepID=UPI0036CE4AD6
MGQKAMAEVQPGSAPSGSGGAGGAGGAEGAEKKNLDLSVAQIAGSSLATVAAALLASQLGVYGTILGAGVVSVVATAGGPVIQHLFKRTGDQLRESARPRARQVPAPAGQQEADGTAGLRAAAPCGEFGEATVHGTRVRGWKRTAVASGTAFAIALGGLGAYEAFSGTAISQGGGTIWSGGTHKLVDEEPAGPGKEPGTGGQGGATPGSGSSPSPSAPHDDRGPEREPSPGPASPDPSGSSGSGDPTPSPNPPSPSPKPTPTPATTPTPTPVPSGKGRQPAP